MPLTMQPKPIPVALPPDKITSRRLLKARHWAKGGEVPLWRLNQAMNNSPPLKPGLPEEQYKVAIALLQRALVYIDEMDPNPVFRGMIPGTARPPALFLTGRYDTNTVTAVLNFQTAAGLKDRNGARAGAETLQALDDRVLALEASPGEARMAAVLVPWTLAIQRPIR